MPLIPLAVGHVPDQPDQPKGETVMLKRFARATALALVAVALSASVAFADPQPGSNNGNSFVCNGNNADPPPCPGK